MSVWSVDRIDMLKRLWAEGLSASLIAKKLGGITRNSAIGKAHRLGLESRKTAHSLPNPGRTRKARIVDKMPHQTPLEAFVSEAAALEGPKAPGIPILKATSTTCRSVEGHEVNEQGYTLAVFCSNPKTEEASFCPFHQAIYYRKDTR